MINLCAIVLAGLATLAVRQFWWWQVGRQVAPRRAAAARRLTTGRSRPPAGG
ncbi:hypothetical protein [Micromonospora sp. 4G55]|uniref:hypothetical protein n=1 Tax=Micromonospora sp. 4G55 TaxID=2806102 RepID=UPI001EE3EF7B|nr:hypothetical protein [Micromonospora sp. 4G55]